MSSPSVSHVKRAQKESLLFRELSDIFFKARLDDDKLVSLTLNRVSLSQDKGSCTLLFYTELGKEVFDKQLLKHLLRYKGPFRKELASRINARYTPELIFAFDKNFDKQMHLENLLEQVKKKD